MDQPTIWTHTLSLPPQPESAARARDFVCAHLLVHGLAPMVDDVRLVASELTTNALQHARTPLIITLERRGHNVVLSVEDGSSSLPIPRSVDGSAPRGRGLAIVDQLSTAWGVDVAAERSKAVWARFETGRTMAPEW